MPSIMNFTSFHVPCLLRHQLLRSNRLVLRRTLSSTCTTCHKTHQDSSSAQRLSRNSRPLSSGYHGTIATLPCATSSGNLVARDFSDNAGPWLKGQTGTTEIGLRGSGRLLQLGGETALSMPSRDFMNLFGSSQPTEWAKAISEAEKVVGYSTSFMSLRCLLSDELANVALHMRKLVGSKHPLLKTAKNFLTDGKHSLQTRGLIILLISKAASTLAHQAPRDSGTHQLEDTSSDQGAQINSTVAPPPGGIYASQRALAEISEMIHTAFLVHRGVVNLFNLDPSAGPINVMEMGNKMAVLSGDFLLASACKALAGLRNTTVVELLSKAIGHLTEAAFMKFGNADLSPVLTIQPDLTFRDWERYIYLSSGTLIGHSCRGALELTNHSQALTESAYNFGKNLAWAQQLHTELQPFTSSSSSRIQSNIDLTSAPVLLYLESDQGQRSEVSSSRKPDVKKLMREIRQSPALDKAKSLCLNYADNALQGISVFPASDSRTALQNMVHAVRI
nr:all trans-polyprenyl-diphosphate synthase PDSS2-like [Lytechinus pictus]